MLGLKTREVTYYLFLGTVNSPVEMEFLNLKKLKQLRLYKNLRESFK